MNASPLRPARVAIIYYSAAGHVHALARAIAEGAAEAGAEVRLRPVAELPAEMVISQTQLWGRHRAELVDEPTAALEDLEWADGIAFGTPTRFGNVAAQLKMFLDQAFRRDFERNGPSLFRICQTTFQGWKRYHNDPDLRIRRRFAEEARKLRTTYNAALWAMEKRLRNVNPLVSSRIRDLRREIEHAFGTFTRLVRMAAGPVLVWTSKREDRRLAKGVTYEPQTFIERRNWVA